MKMTKQRLMGLALVAVSVLLLLLASTGETPEERDATAVLLTLPLGVYMMTTKNYILYDGEGPVEEEEEQPGPQLPGHMTRKEINNGRKKKNCRGSRLQDMGGSRRRAPGGR